MSEPEPSAAALPSSQDPSVATGPKSPLLDADGRERPRFLAEFPNDPALNVLVQAFERGDFAYVRAHAAEVVSSATDPTVKAAASDLLQRIEPDPTLKLLLGLALGVFLFLVSWVYWGH